MEKDKGGRPRKYDSLEEFESKIKEYMTNCPDTVPMKVGDKVRNVPAPTITGMAIYLGFVDRRSMYDYEKNGKFSHAVKRARTFIENEYEKMLRSNNATGAIFALKNFGWNDKRQHDHTTNGESISINVIPPDGD